MDFKNDKNIVLCLGDDELKKSARSKELVSYYRILKHTL